MLSVPKPLVQLSLHSEYRKLLPTPGSRHSIFDLLKDYLCSLRGGKRYHQSIWLTTFHIGHQSPLSEKDADFVVDEEWLSCQLGFLEPSLHSASVSEAPTPEFGWIMVGFDPSNPIYPSPLTLQMPTSDQPVGGFVKSETPNRPGHDTPERCDPTASPIDLQIYLILQLA